jgi:anti-anti-sigma regulatory factor
MLQSLLAIHPTDPTQIARGRLLKRIAIIVTIAVLVFIPVSINNPTNPVWFTPSLIGLAAMFIGVFFLARNNYIRIGGGIMCASQMIFISLAGDPANLATGNAGMIYIVPIMIAGMILGANSTIIVGIITSLLLLLVPTLRDIPWNTRVIVTVFVMMIVTVLLWLIISMLEGLFQNSEQQRLALLDNQVELAQREQILLDTNNNLHRSNDEMTRLIDLVRELEIPIIPLLSGVLVVPLVGQLDTRRMNTLMTMLLSAVHNRRSRIVILDITGVSLIDTAVAMYLQEMARAIRLLGAQAMLAGINANIAQTITQLGISFEGIQTFAQLQDSVAVVLREDNHLNE